MISRHEFFRMVHEKNLQKIAPEINRVTGKNSYVIMFYLAYVLPFAIQHNKLFNRVPNYDIIKMNESTYRIQKRRDAKWDERISNLGDDMFSTYSRSVLKNISNLQSKIFKKKYFIAKLISITTRYTTARCYDEQSNFSFSRSVVVTYFIRANDSNFLVTIPSENADLKLFNIERLTRSKRVKV